MKVKLDNEFILKLFDELNGELKKINIIGELYLLGGAVMCLQFHSRPSTFDIDAVFAPKKDFKKAIKKVAFKNDLDPDWINDAAKGFLSDAGTFDNLLDKSNLKVFCTTAEYLLAMKCMSMRLGVEFHDESDIRFLLRYLNIERVEQAVSIIEKFYRKKLIPQKTFYALEEILDN